MDDAKAVALIERFELALAAQRVELARLGAEVSRLDREVCWLRDRVNAEGGSRG